MGQKTPISTSFNLPDGREVTIETGKLATQADGSVVVKCGKTMLFASVVSAKKAKEGQAFFPLSVDYQEKYAASGRIPGNFFRREARLSDYEILISRLVDRAIRPLFPDGYMNETQVIINLISGDEETLPDAMVALAASSAIVTSNIPWAGPISEVRVARIDGIFKVNPTRSEMSNADFDIIVAATDKDVMMVEGAMNEAQEDDLVEAIKIGHEAIKTQIAAQLALVELVGDKAKIKREIELPEVNEALDEEILQAVEGPIMEIARGKLDKKSRKEGFEKVLKELLEKWEEEKGSEFIEENEEYIQNTFDKLKKKLIRKMMLEENTRLDGRNFDEVRPIWTEVDYLPAAHGSAIFNRGETQVLSTLTLGTKQDQLMRDTALDMSYEDFILHYNFPAFSVGETKPMRGPGRREVGHANLASRALRPLLPKDYPYTLRIVADVLESNGSSSMATVCSGSLALMDAGVPIRTNVSGIAMGMIKEGDDVAILSDILGDEDALGDMDFKVTGTKDGITACQMDIKIEGLPYDLLIKALQQAKEGRLHILDKLNEAMSEPREDLKEHAPRIEEIIIDKSFIGAVIGPGGKIIQEIQATTDTTISIDEVDDKGIVQISSNNKESIEKAKKMVMKIVFVPSVGDIYDGRVASVMPYGVFVDFMGKSGLLHVSEIAHHRVEKVEDYFKEGDEVKIKIVDIDSRTGKFRLSAKALIPKPEGGGDQNRGRGGRNDRHGRSNHNRNDRR